MAAIAGTRRVIESPVTIAESEPRHDGDDRYRIYIMVRTTKGDRVHQQIADTDLQGIGPCLATLREEGQITNDDRIGIRDRLDRKWIVNPYATGRPA